MWQAKRTNSVSEPAFLTKRAAISDHCAVVATDYRLEQELHSKDPFQADLRLLARTVRVGLKVFGGLANRCHRNIEDLAVLEGISETCVSPTVCIYAYARPSSCRSAYLSPHTHTHTQTRRRTQGSDTLTSFMPIKHHQGREALRSYTHTHDIYCMHAMHARRCM